MYNKDEDQKQALTETEIDETSPEQYENINNKDDVIRQVREQQGDIAPINNQDFSSYQQGVSEKDYEIEEKGKISSSFGSNNYKDDEKQISEENIARLSIPNVDTEFYANYKPSLQELDEKVARGEHWTEREAETFAMAQGLESTIRENNRLAEAIKEANRTKKMALMTTVVLGGLLVAMLFAFTQYPKNRYIATKDNTAICEVKPTNNPFITDVTVAEFAKSAVLEMYSFDYINGQLQIERALSRYFTSEGRIDAVQAIETSGLVTHVSQNALTLRATAANAPMVEEKGITNGNIPVWTVRFPLIIDVFSGEKMPKETQRHIATVRLRADNASAANPTGLGVLSVTLVPDNSPQR